MKKKTNQGKTLDWSMEKAMILIQTSSYGRLFIPWTWLALDMFYSSPDCRRLSIEHHFPVPGRERYNFMNIMTGDRRIGTELISYHF
ncbi:hypothetical protein ACPV3A_00155 [Paenibacillus sp. Dod16]|uniref:hypothetical protein n=1 Tax=Paenibacillus sp. Dod16 TaxID=3416392 RepID=UPI003CF8A80A